MKNREEGSAREVYKRAFDAVTGMSGWHIGLDKWMYTPEIPAPLTRDEAFKNICKRSRR